MAFHDALTLVLLLEGGKSNRADDAGGPTNKGMTQKTWHSLGYEGSVLDASDIDLANAYRKLWDGTKIYSLGAGVGSVFALLPEPADSVAFQCFVNLPWMASMRLFQHAVGTTADGLLGSVTARAISAWNGHGRQLSKKILMLQKTHYDEFAQPQFLPGLMNRIAKVEDWLAER